MAGQPAASPSCPGWNLAAEFRHFPNQANPNPDNCGNANVWYFMESRSLARDPLTYSLLPEFITDAFFIRLKDGCERRLSPARALTSVSASQSIWTATRP
jgi:hypothetical protein